MTLTLWEPSPPLVSSQKGGRWRDESFRRDTTPWVLQSSSKVDFSFNPLADPKFCFYDHSLVDAVKRGDPATHQFFRLLSLCHTVMPEEKRKGMLVYQAQSPDEGALVTAARNFGFVFRARTPETITVVEMGKTIVYELLAILDFNSVRKRMSVIVRCPKGKVTLYCKGADTILYELLDPSCGPMKEKTTYHLDEFAGEGLRTLVVAYRTLEQEYFENWQKRHHEASTALDNREEKLSVLYEEIEKDLMVWRVRGGGGENARGRVGWPIGQFRPGRRAHLSMDQQRTGGITNLQKYWKMSTIAKRLWDFRVQTDKVLEHNTPDITVVEKKKVWIIDVAIPTVKEEEHALAEYVKQKTSQSTADKKTSTRKPHYKLELTAGTTKHCMEIISPSMFTQMTKAAKIIISVQIIIIIKHTACRESDIKNTKRIKLKTNRNLTAHIGVGISGQEGMQAVLSSDFSFAQFRFLQRLLLVHGRWSYLRMCKFLSYFFYKNFTFTLVHFWYGFFSGFSAQTVYDEWFITLYNMVYTSLPVLGMSLFDQDVDDCWSLQFPQLYVPGQRNLFFNKRQFAKCTLYSLYSSLVLFFVPFGAVSSNLRTDGHSMADYQSFAVVAQTCLLVVVSVQMGLDTAYWTVINQLFIWGSLAMYFAITFTMYSDGMYLILTGSFPFVGTARNTLNQPTVWLSVGLCVALCVLPVVGFRFLKMQLRPTISDKVEKVVQYALRLRRGSSRRSGYAFSHQHGFGALITSGRNMRARAPFSFPTSLVPSAASVASRARK
uniref:P-type ATPase C-terminal domain-containing protein n=1 Tax=Anolis carolinensis TaxID=28377 RepID=H9GVL9_ANOCA